MCAIAMAFEPDVMVFLNFLGPYIGAGIPAVLTGLKLSREHRHLRRADPFKCEAVEPQ